jgi:hypothetical protein
MDFSQFLLALRARRKAFMLALVATIVAALAVAFVMPKKYVGQATLIVDARDEQAIIPSRSSVSLSTRAAYVATQIELVQSGRSHGWPKRPEPPERSCAKLAGHRRRQPDRNVDPAPPAAKLR